MRKLLLSSIFFLVFATHCRPQCNPIIPDTVTVINFTQMAGGGGGQYWVCGGDSIDSGGGGQTVYLEPGAWEVGGGGSQTIWCPPGAYVDFNGSGSNTIYYVCPESLIDPGNSPTLIQCTAIHYDYAIAPSPGCPQLSTSAICPVAANFTASATSICGTEQCIDFFDSSASSPTNWQWFFPSAVPDTSTLQNPSQICFSQPGTYSVTLVVTNANGNDTLTMNNYITVYTLPVAPSITQSGDTLFVAQGYTSYQWFYASDTISGETDYFYVVPLNGNYNIIVTDSNSCSVGAGILNVISLTPALSKGAGVNVYPNPARENITVTLVNSQSSIVSLKIFNSIGQEIYFSEEKNVSGKFYKDISLKDFAEGIYLVQIKSSSLTSIKKFIVVK